MAVVLHHFFPGHITGGYVGVDVFFVISGFVITSVILRAWRQQGFSIRDFYLRRMRRILPAMLLMMLVVLVLSAIVLLPRDVMDTARAALASLAFVSNIFFWDALDQGYFGTFSKYNPLLHNWSLSVEEQFYLVFPLLLVLVLRGGRGAALGVLAGLALLSLWAAQTAIPARMPMAFFFFHTRAWELLAGAMLALASPGLIQGGAHDARQPPGRSFLAAVTGLLMIMLAVVTFSPRTEFPGINALLPVVGTLLLIKAGQGRGNLISSLLASAPYVGVGRLSYSLYLWHWPVLVLYAARFPGPRSALLNAGLMLLSLLLAYLSWRFVESRFRFGKETWVRSPWTHASAAGVVAVVALICLAGQGWPQRFDERQLMIIQTRNADVPWMHCDFQRHCRLGDRSAKADYLVWGDSHMLALAPALDQVLDRRGEAARLAFGSACMPAPAHAQSRGKCRDMVATIRAGLQLPGSPAAVVIHAHWHHYLDQPGFRENLRELIDSLLAEERVLVLIGPVPIWERNVPDVLVYGGAENRPGSLKQSREDYRRASARFWQVVEDYDHPNLRVIDPSSVLCRPECSIADETGIWYRDSHHLSPEGSLQLARALEDALFEDVKSGPAILD